MSAKYRLFAIPLALVLGALIAAWSIASAMSSPAGQDLKKPKSQTVVPQKAAQGKPTIPAKAPKVYIDNKAVNVGEVLEQVDINYTFRVKNIGVGELQILGVRPG